MKSFVQACRTYSIPLIAGVLASLAAANLFPHAYHHIVHTPIIGEINLHFLVNDIFMVFFFATAGVEIVNSMSKGGALNPVKKAVTPLMATAGGVLGPVILFFILNAVLGDPMYSNGWGICTATDIALSWLIAKLIFGADHPAIKFLLLLAVVDDAIGLFIIAIFYPSPDKPFQPLWLVLIPVAMLIAFLMKKKNVKPFMAYVLICGTISWIGMHTAGLHAALSMVFIVPFFPKGNVVAHPDGHGTHDAAHHSTLHNFEEKVTPIVDFGLFFFGFTAAGVEFSSVSALSFIIMISLIIGKAIGIFTMTLVSTRLGFGLPEGMRMNEVALVGIIGGIGLTVALFVCESAFTDPILIASAKMGALGSIFAAILAFVVSPFVKRVKAAERDADRTDDQIEQYIPYDEDELIELAEEDKTDSQLKQYPDNQ